MIEFAVNLDIANWLIYLFSIIGIVTMLSYVAITVVRFVTYFQIKNLKLSNEEKSKAYVDIFKYKDEKNESN